MEESWKTILVVCLALTAALGLGYRIYRWTKKGPPGDVWGQAVLAAVLIALAVGVGRDWTWARWASVGFGAFFGAVVMPLWVLAVLIPMRPRRLDIAYTAAYWALLIVLVIAGIAA